MKKSSKFLFWGTLPATIFAAGCTEQNKTKSPNVMVILLDDAGYNDFGFMGSPDLETPNIDALSREGIILTDAHVSASVSGPSRSGLLTGRYQQRNGYECNLEDTLGTGLNEEMISDIFKRNGYHTSIFGKWHQGNAPAYHPNNRGFDHFFGFISGSRAYFYTPEKDDKPGNTHNLQFNGKQLEFDGYLTDVLADNASEYIQERAKADEPFMMYLSFNAVHSPMQATKEDLARFKGHPRQKLAAMTWAVDRGIGKVISTLKETGEFDNTLIFFLSDNGGAFYNQSSNYPLKGNKGNKFEGGHRVPFFVVYGDRFKGKADYDGLASSLDIIPTAMAAAGIPETDVKNPLDGVNLLPYLDGEKEGEPHHELYWRKDGMAAARIGDYKYIRVKGVGERLYNLKDNLGEDQDLCAAEPEKLNQMRNAIQNWEKGLINPVLWDEGIWIPVTTDIHRNLMENKPVDVTDPKSYKKKYGHN